METPAQAARTRNSRYWTDLAQTLERGLFDGLFIADVLGVYDVYGGNPDTALRGGVQVPVNDPLLLVSAMAAVTEHLGFGITASTGSSPPSRSRDAFPRSTTSRRGGSAGTSSPAT